MNFPKINKKAALIATAIGTLVVSNVATYKNAYSSGYKTSIIESRVGYITVPEVSGAFIVSEVNGKPHYSFEAYPSQPIFSASKAWNSDENRKFLEWSIQNNAKVDDKSVSYATAACTPQTTTNFWDCAMRKLGENYTQHWRIEVNPKTGNWSA
jgi:hypothetical protein